MAEKNSALPFRLPYATIWVYSLYLYCCWHFSSISIGFVGKANAIMKCILLHGLGQTSSSWKKTIDEMDGKLNIDCPNLFALLQEREINYSNLYQAFSDYCKAYSEPLDICGLSLGGILALQYGIENPGRVNSMVLIGTQYVMPEKLLKFQNAIFHIMPSSAFEKMGLQKKDVINLSSSMMNLNFQQDLHKIDCPVLIICGKKDKANMQASLQLKALIPRAKLTVIQNAGHEVNIDAPKNLGMALNDFLCADKSRFGRKTNG